MSKIVVIMEQTKKDLEKLKPAVKRIGPLKLPVLDVKIFPDPYHRGQPVGLFTWVSREINELIKGEK